METNPTRMCQLLVDLPEVHVIGIDKDPGQPMRVHVETPDGRPDVQRAECSPARRTATSSSWWTSRPMAGPVAWSGTRGAGGVLMRTAP